MFTVGDKKGGAADIDSLERVARRPKRIDRSEDFNEFLDSDHLSFFDGKCLVRVANSITLRQKAYRFQHKAYEKLGIVGPEEDALWVTIHDALPQTTTFIAEEKSGELSGTVTLVFDSAVGLPADSLFPSEMEAIRSTDTRICELISFGANSKMQGSVKILAGLFYSSFLFARYARKATDYVITVHERHEKFYCANLLFKRIGPVRCYSKVNGEPTVFLHLSLDRPEQLRRQKRIFPFSFFTYSASQENFFAKKINESTAPLSPAEFKFLFTEKTDLWQNASPALKELIRPLYASDS